MNKLIFASIALTGAILISWKTMTDKKTYKAIDLSNFNTKSKPGDNFYDYVNGNWLKKNPIPASETGWGSFKEIRESNINNLKVILDDATKANAAKGSITQKIGDFYFSALDSANIEAQGIKPIQSEFDKIAAMKTLADLPSTLSHLHYVGIDGLFNLGISPDAKNSTRNIIQMYQGGLSLPDKDYYLKDDSKFTNIRISYQLHIKKMFVLLGDDEKIAGSNSIAVLSIENDLAKLCRSRSDLRNSEANYNLKTYAEVKALTPDFNWDNYFSVMGIKDLKEANVGQPEFYSGMNTVLKKHKIDDWKTYLRWNLINQTAHLVGEKYNKEHFAFFGTTLSGSKEMRPRWKRALDATDRALGEALGQAYAEKHFTAESKQKVNTMIDNLVAAYRDRITTRPWMSEETKKKALEKLNAISRKIGYPDKWMDYTKLDITRDSYVMNQINANIFLSDYVIGQLNKPVDKTRWGMTPPTVNAYYSSSINEIVFPAGILQPPFYNADADDAVNYGSMGSIIGHELTHGFDDEGSKFDAVGNMQDWWTPTDKENFQKKTQQLVDQYDGYQVLDSVHVNGKLTLGENIADLGGITLSYYAFKKSLEGKPAPAKIDGFTAEQRFFISWAQAWRNEMQPESRRNQIMTDPHSPGEFRANGPVSNMQEFYDAFAIKPGAKLYKPENERINIW